MGIVSDIFTWWNGTTLSTRLYTKRHGVLVGEDASGNKYYEDKKAIREDVRPGAKAGKSAGPARRRRWVIYPGLAEASKVPPEWHGWLHYILDEPPGHDYQNRAWQKPHAENKTGTPDAYRPAGSILATHRRRPGAPDYEPWRAE
jgi:NADH:ubiquinone oxidoreductase subunit